VTILTGLIGWPVEHSLSPAMHNAAFEALGLDGRYDLLPVQPGELAARLPDLAAYGYVGLNVTVPHKEEALALADRATQIARVIGAANTFTLRDGVILADNTDAPGFLADLEAEGVEASTSALVLGAGGAGRAIVYALASAEAQVNVVDRIPKRAKRLEADLKRDLFFADVTAYPLSALEEAARDVELVVNCTSLGMWPHVDASSWPDDLPFPATARVAYDLVYRPRKTRFLAQAEAAGVRPIGGLGMLVRQGALSFEAWTGKEAPVEVMRAAAEAILSGED
jgi:shikimate dehydrogenase